ncbi:Cytochrome b6 [Gossypium arboreum]|uniref:Cytochrome b6 n=1 Tax=Gossypium arboreum TaxID=29729 RepID=A0A0B0N8W3_GOSAR|nr:Cytochrome b6 [Gossypium arboreum]
MGILRRNDFVKCIFDSDIEATVSSKIVEDQHYTIELYFGYVLNDQKKWPVLRSFGKFKHEMNNVCFGIETGLNWCANMLVLLLLGSSTAKAHGRVLWPYEQVNMYALF